ncbi:MAG TPA: VWA domain-containing protein [Chitinophagaceae bacterium]|nr:VWA domain-containing protein [Chitinophagaceae bacterium]
MKKQKTIYHLIVDKSGSMADVTHQTITGYNEQVQQIQSVQRDFPEQLITIGLSTFNGNVEHYYFGVPAGNATWLSNQNYVPDGSTSLYDAIGSSVQRLEQQQATDIMDFDTTVVVIILTDGYENSSRTFRLVDIKRMIARLEETGKWTFSFIGATLDAVEVAAQMDIKAQNSFAFSKETMKEEVWDRVNHSVRTYANKRRKGENLDDLYQ